MAITQSRLGARPRVLNVGGDGTQTTDAIQNVLRGRDQGISRVGVLQLGLGAPGIGGDVGDARGTGQTNGWRLSAPLLIGPWGAGRPTKRRKQRIYNQKLGPVESL